MKFYKKILIGFICLGILLALINFFNFRSLWLDEAMLALNIVEKSGLELLKPLDHSQVAPIGFLLMGKLFASLFSNQDGIKEDEYIMNTFKKHNYQITDYQSYPGSSLYLVIRE